MTPLAEAKAALIDALSIYDSNAPLGPYAAEQLTREALAALSRIEAERGGWGMSDRHWSVEQALAVLWILTALFWVVVGIVAWEIWQ